MNASDINKGLVVYDDTFGLLIVDGMLDDRGVTQADLVSHNAHI